MMNRKAYPLILLVFACFFLGVAYAEPKYTALNVYEYYDDSITPYMFFDEANYIYVTPYGNYTFLQPGNILQYTDFRGQEIIEKSFFVTQYDNYGNWLPFLDFSDRVGGDPFVAVANDTYYEWRYNIYDKKVIIATGKLSFTVDLNPAIPPKIHTEITPNENWATEGYGDFRWIWDIVPWVNLTTNLGYTYYMNQTSGDLTDIRDFLDLRELYTAQPDGNETETYEDINNQIRIRITDTVSNVLGILDVSSYNTTTWYGGEIPNWNSKGFVTIFPVNEAVIDPITYTESAPAAIDESGWGAGWNTDEDCGAAPAGSVAEIIAVNESPTLARTAGVRNTTSGVDRYLSLNEAEDGGVTATRFLVQVDGSGNADFYITAAATQSYYLVGYWEDVTFTGQWDNHYVTNTQDDMWFELDGPTDLGLIANRTHLITIANQDNAAQFLAGVRQSGGADANRWNQIMEAEATGVQTMSMFVQAREADGDIDVYSAQWDDIEFINQGYFDDTVGFVELFVSLPLADNTWETEDLTAYLDQDGRIVDILCFFQDSFDENYVGARQKGAGTDRYFLIRESEGGGGVGYGMTVQSDANGQIEIYTGAPGSDWIYLTGYFVFAEGGITEYIRGVTQGVSVASSVTRVTVCYRATSQSVSVASDTTRVLGAKRGTTQGISMASAVGRLYGAVRNPTQGITVASAISRGFNALRGVSQGITAGSAFSRVLGAFRGVTQSITTGSAASKLFTSIRGLTQSINVAGSVSRGFGAVRGTTQSINVASAVTRAFNAIRGVTQGITTSSAVSRVYTIIRGLTQSVTLSSSVGREYVGSRGLTQSVSVANAVSRGLDAIRGVTQSITTSTAVSRVYTIIRGLTQAITVGSDTTRRLDAVRSTTQGISVSSAITRTFAAIRGVSQSITTNTAVTRLYTIIRGLTQSFTVGSGVSRTFQAVRGLTQSVDMASAVSRGFNAIRGLTQGLTIDNAVSRIYGAKRGVTQAVNMANAVTRIYTQSIIEFIRGVSQSITTSSTVTRTFSAVRGVSQSIGFDESVSRLYTIIRGLTQSIAVGTDTTRLYNGVRGVTQSVTVGSGVSRVFAAIRSVSQSVTMSSAVTRIHGMIRSVTQSIDVANAVTRLRGVFRGVTQGISVNSVVTRAFNAIRGVSQSIDAASAVTRAFNAIRGVSQSIDIANAVTRIYTSLGIEEFIRGVTQSINFSGNVSRLFEAIRGVTQGITASTSVTRIRAVFRGVTQSIGVSSTSDRLASYYRNLYQLIQTEFVQPFPYIPDTVTVIYYYPSLSLVLLAAVGVYFFMKGRQ